MMISGGFYGYSYFQGSSCITEKQRQTNIVDIVHSFKTSKNISQIIPEYKMELEQMQNGNLLNKDNLSDNEQKFAEVEELAQNNLKHNIWWTFKYFNKKINLLQYKNNGMLATSDNSIITRNQKADNSNLIMDVGVLQKGKIQTRIKNYDISEISEFMVQYCNTRLLYVDYSCNKYAIIGCYKYSSDNKKLPPKCLQIAYRKLKLMFVHYTCISKWGLNNTKLGLGNNILNLNQDTSCCLDVFTVIAFWLMIQIYSFGYKYYTQKYDENFLTPVDFTVMIKGLPKLKDLEYNILHNLRDLIHKEGFDTAEINIVYNYEQFDGFYSD